MRIYYYYCSTVLGFVEKTEDGYMYTSNIPNERELKKNLLITESRYTLFDSFERESKELFPEFKEFCRSMRDDILCRAKINSGDSEWDMLVKLSKLKWYPSGFYVQDKLNETKQKKINCQTNDDNTW